MTIGEVKKAEKRLFAALLSKRITRIQLHPFDNGNGGFACHPRIYLSDGSHLTFDTQETETEYGTMVNHWKPKTLPKPTKGKAGGPPPPELVKLMSFPK